MSASQVFAADGCHWITSVCLIRGTASIFTEVFSVERGQVRRIGVEMPVVNGVTPADFWDPATVVEHRVLDDLTLLPEPERPADRAAEIPQSRVPFFRSRR